MVRRLPRWARFALLVIGLGLGTGLAWWLYQVGSAAVDLARAGAFSTIQEREYEADREGNLRAVHQALVLVSASDGSLPGKDWQQAAMLRLKTRDLSEDEARKKLVPVGSKAKSYRLNESAVGKNTEDLEPDTVLVFESTNADGGIGRPESGLKAVTVDGRVLTVP